MNWSAIENWRSDLYIYTIAFLYIALKLKLIFLQKMKILGLKSPCRYLHFFKDSIIQNY